MEHYFETREEWRDWLRHNHSRAEEAWIIYYKKSSGKPSMPYNEAVEEALCYGWIDGKVNRVNKDYYKQRFTPRRKRSKWSKYNIERVQKLIKEGKMEPAGLAAYREVLGKPHLVYDNRSDGEPELPADLFKALNSNKSALNNFMSFSQSARRIYINWLNSAKRSETRERRIEKIVVNSEKKMRPGQN